MASTVVASSPNAARPLRTLTVPPRRALALPILCSAGLAAVALYGPVRENARLFWSILDSAAVLLGWTVVLFLAARRSGRRFTLELVPRPQHYVQACAHTSIFLYWGWYWRAGLRRRATLIVAQLLFAYAFDMLLGWSRRDTYTLGFGPFPIIFSTNLFLWFKAGLVLPAVPDDRRRLRRQGVHPLEQGRTAGPHLQPLVVPADGLLAGAACRPARATSRWGQDIAITQFYPPHMYLFLFLVALPGQFLFGVTTMTMSAVVTTYLFGLGYFGRDRHLLFLRLVHSDCRVPRHAPAVHRSVDGAADRTGAHHLRRAVRAEHGRAVRAARQRRPADVLRQASAGAAAQPVDPAHRSGGPQRLRCGGSIRQRSAARLLRAGATWPYMSIWAIVFAAMSAAQGVGDHHRGQWIPFWQQACAENRPRACAVSRTVLHDPLRCGFRLVVQRARHSAADRRW